MYAYCMFYAYSYSCKTGLWVSRLLTIAVTSIGWVWLLSDPREFIDQLKAVVSLKGLDQPRRRPLVTFAFSQPDFDDIILLFLSRLLLC